MLNKGLSAYTSATSFFQEIRVFLFDSSCWELLPEEAKTRRYVNMAFSILARSAGGLTQLLMPFQKGYPIKLFGLLTTDASTLACQIENEWKAVPCMFDSMSAKVMAVYPTAKDLLSKDLSMCVRSHVFNCSFGGYLKAFMLGRSINCA